MGVCSMFVANDGQQIAFDDSTFRLTARERKMLEKSWAIPFSERIFPAIDEKPFSVLYSDNASRPNTPVNVLVGALILKEFLGQSDDEIRESLIFDLRYQVALHTTSFQEQPLSDRSLGRFRARNTAYEEETGIDLIHNCVIFLSKEIAEIMKINSSLRRMDSLMVASNIKKMSRLELLYTCVSNMVNLLAGDDPETLPENLRHYCSKDDRNVVIYHNRSEKTSDRIEQVLRDAEELLPLCSGKFDDASEYQLLLRVLREQTVRNEQGSYRLKEASDPSMNSSMLQNPADPDASFREKTGKQHRGYVANVTESVGENGSVVTDYQYEQNNHSDSQFLDESLAETDVQPEKGILVADGGYSGTNHRLAAEEKNIELVTTGLIGRKAKDVYADFEFNERGDRVLRCATDKEPKSCSYVKQSGQCRVSFPRSACENCPRRKECQPKIFKRRAVVTISIKSKERAQQQRLRNMEAFSILSAIRNGVESIPSILRRKYRIDHMPVRGKIPTKHLFGFKIAALNFKKFWGYLQCLGKGMQNLETV